MLACVASDSDKKVAEYLHLIFILRNYMSGIELFMQDAELISVVILSDVGRDSSKTASTISSTSQIPWGTITLGQCVIIMEFMLTIRQLRLQPEVCLL